MLEQIKIENKPGKGFKPESWKNIIEGFKERTSITYDQTQLKNFYDRLRGSWQAYRGLIATLGWVMTRMRRPSPQMSNDDKIWLRQTQKVKEFRTRLLQFENKLDTPFVGNSVRGDSSWIPTGNTPPPFNSSSTGSALHGVDQVTERVKETRDSLNS